jgi:hypothetical protein
MLDGVQRCGLPITVTDLPDWAPSNPQSNYYLEGGTYTYENGYWRLALNLSPSGSMGASVEWAELDPTWQWAQFDPAITWGDLWGVGVAGSDVIWRRLTASLRRRMIAGN